MNQTLGALAILIMVSGCATGPSRAEVLRERMRAARSCQDADIPTSDVRALVACADRELREGDVAAARVRLEAAVAKADASTACDVVQRVDRLPDASSFNLGSISPETAARCRAETPRPAPPVPASRASAGAEAAVDQAVSGAGSAGVQLEGQLTNEGAGLGLGIAAGVIVDRVSLLLAPSFAAAFPTDTSTVSAWVFTLTGSAKIALGEQEVGALVPYVRPLVQFSVGSVAAGGLSSSVQTFGAGATVGGQALVGPRLGLFAEWGVVGTFGTVGGVGTIGALGIVFREASPGR